MQTNVLKGRMRERGLTQADIAKALGLSLSRLNAKLNETSGAEFSVGEATEIRKILDLSNYQCVAIFLE